MNSKYNILFELVASIIYKKMNKSVIVSLLKDISEITLYITIREMNVNTGK